MTVTGAHQKNVQFFHIAFCGAGISSLVDLEIGRQKTLAAHITARSVGDTGGSSDSDESALDQKTPTGVACCAEGWIHCTT